MSVQCEAEALEWAKFLDAIYHLENGKTYVLPITRGVFDNHRRMFDWLTGTGRTSSPESVKRSKPKFKMVTLKVGIAPLLCDAINEYSFKYASIDGIESEKLVLHDTYTDKTIDSLLRSGDVDIVGRNGHYTEIHVSCIGINIK